MFDPTNKTTISDLVQESMSMASFKIKNNTKEKVEVKIVAGSINKP